MAAMIVDFLLGSDAVREAAELSVQSYLSMLREKLIEKGVEESVVDLVFECMEDITGDGNDAQKSTVKRHLGGKPAPKAKIVSGADAGEGEKEDLRVKHDGKEVIVCLNYGPKSHALFGDFGKTHEKFKESFLKSTKFIGSGPKLAFGFGWVVKDKSKLPEVLAALKKAKIPFREVEREEYENEVREKKGGKVEEVEESEGEEEETPEEKPVPKKEAAKKPAPKETPKEKPAAKKPATAAPKKEATKPAEKSETTTKLSAKKNDWGNNEEEETGFVFMKLAVGKNGTSIPIVVGWQDPDCKTSEKGLKSVNPLDDEAIEDCKKRKWKYLTEDMIATIRKKNQSQAKALQEVMDKNDEEEDAEEAEDSDAEAEESGEEDAEEDEE